MPCYFVYILNAAALLVLLIVLTRTLILGFALLRQVMLTEWDCLPRMAGKQVYPAALIASGRKFVLNFLGFFLFVGLLAAANQVHLSCAA